MFCRILKVILLLYCRYESIIATLCENLDSLDEPDARAAMIWIVGEYAERIDNADELLESFLEGFHDESTQVGEGDTRRNTSGHVSSADVVRASVSRDERRQHLGVSSSCDDVMDTQNRARKKRK